MPIPLVANPIPQFRGPDGGDIGRAFLNSFFASRNEVRQQQDQAMQMEQNQYNRDVMRPLQEESMKLGLSERRQSMDFAKQDQTWQNDSRTHDKALWPLHDVVATNAAVRSAQEVQKNEADLAADTTKRALEMQTMAQLGENMAILGQPNIIQPGISATPAPSRAVFPGAAPVPVGSSPGSPNSLLPSINYAITALPGQPGAATAPPLPGQPGTDAQYLDKAGRPLQGQTVAPAAPAPVQPVAPPATPTAPVAPAAPLTYTDQWKAQVAHTTKQLASYDATVRLLPFLPEGPVKTSTMMTLAKLQADPTFGVILKNRENEKLSLELGHKVGTAVLSQTPTFNRAFAEAHGDQFKGVDVKTLPDGNFDLVKRIPVVQRTADGKVHTAIVEQPMTKQEKEVFLNAYANFKPKEADDLSATVLKEYASLAKIAGSAENIGPDVPPEKAQIMRQQAKGAADAMAVMRSNDSNLARNHARMIAEQEAAAMEAEKLMGKKDGTKKEEEPKKKTLDASFPTAAQTAKAEAQKSEQQKTLESITKYAPAIERVFPDDTKLPDKANLALQIAAKVVRNESSRFTRDGRELTQDEKGQWDWTGEHVDRSYALHVAEKAGLVTPEAGAGERSRAIATVEAWAKHKLEVQHGYDLGTNKGKAPSADEAKTVEALKKMFTAGSK